jgi:hypothetical protein
MPRFYNEVTLKQTFFDALAGNVKIGVNAENFPKGVVELSAFKFYYVTVVEPNDFLPSAEELMHLHFWEYLSSKLPKPLFNEIESITSNLVAELVANKTITLGGRVEHSCGISEYPEGGDYIVSVSAQKPN